MIQAFFKGKSAIQFIQNEDFKTSSSIGLLQYLPDNLFWSIMRDCCVGLTTNNFGKILSFNFWEHTDSTNTTNSSFVEPDVWIETKEYDVLIEAKVGDGYGQYYQQWHNEIQSLLNEQNNNGYKKPIILIALGGNDNLKPDIVDGFRVFKASWYYLLKAITDERNRQTDNCFISRILDDTIELFARQGMIIINWLNSMPNYGIKEDALSSWSVTPTKSLVGFSNINFDVINYNNIQQWHPIN